MAVEMPGRQTIANWAAFLGVPIGGTMANADMILAPDPDAMKAGGEQLTGIREGLRTGDQDATQLGTDVSRNWSGAAADVFAPKIGELSQGTAQTDAQLGELQQNIMAIANDSAARINAVCNASAVTAAFLGAQAAAAGPTAVPPA